MLMWPSSSTDTGLMSTATEATRTSEPLVDQPQACLSTVDEHPFIPRTLEPRLPQRHRRRTLNDRLSQKNSSALAARSSTQDILTFEPTRSLSSSRSIPVFGKLGRVAYSSLMQGRELNRRMAAEKPRSQEPERDNEFRSGPDFVEIGQYDFSGWLAESESSEQFPSPWASLEIPQDAEMAESLQEVENQPQYVRAALNYGLKQTREYGSLHQSDRSGEDIGMHPILDADEMA
ncbi:hypothetical protein GALMADRAFT_709261 [Galerina marginata CBS 339.88]|uniref:Uncharacterized protein n=1 Tax=Galerina marginata (strain CBS 339.88) TaxID=685588 RepID=A0A067TMG0_GALM3|nr:hypothetical protein GALMADRAFT_709261 [Galerina marginata CBS 339.88]